MKPALCCSTNGRLCNSGTNEMAFMQLALCSCHQCNVTVQLAASNWHLCNKFHYHLCKQHQ